MIESLEHYSLSAKPLKKKGILHKVGIIGCGLIGQEIAIETSSHGIDVVFIDIDEKRIHQIMASMNMQLDEIIDKWGLTFSEKRAILSRIKGTTDYDQLQDCNLIIEAINTKKRGTSFEKRQEIFREVEKHVSRDTVITSNTSTMMISEISKVLKHPERSVGVHFISPVRKVKILEVVKGEKTAKWAFEFVGKFATMINKTVINLHESPGNISTRMIIPLINEACEILMEGVATIEAIDITMKEASGHEFGPFEMADRIGLDMTLKMMDNLYQTFGDRKFKPSSIIILLVRASCLGVKSGRGFYKYEDSKVIPLCLNDLFSVEVKKIINS